MTYPGGKGGCYQRLINLIPPHRVYIAAFAGFDAVMRNKRPASVNIAVDVDSSALMDLRAVIDDTVRNDEAGSGWEFVCADALQWLRQYPFRGDEFVYADPPYLISTRRRHRHLYLFEMYEEEQHGQLLDILVSLPCKVMISGYWSALYENRLAGWVTESFMTQTRGGMAEEWLWMNYAAPVELHDYRYLGDGFRERERIRRKKDRWVNRLREMPRLERLAISAAIAELGDAAVSPKVEGSAGIHR